MNIRLLSIASAVLAVGLAATNVAADAREVHLTGSLAGPTAVPTSLPAPTGPHAVGTTARRLVDPARAEPWRPSVPHRELMVQLWYPTARPGTPAPYMGATAATHMANRYNFTPDSLVNLRTHATADAPVDPGLGPLPLLLFSPGDGGNRRDNTALAEQLASTGYLIAGIDHLGDGLEGELPDGTVVSRTKPELTDETAAAQVQVRVDDMRTVLDALLGTARQSFVDPMPAGLTVDSGRIGAYGHSLGGATVAGAMLADPRIRAGADLDGLVAGPVATAGLDRPFLILRSPWHTRERDPSWRTFLPALRGWHRNIAVDGAGHYAFADLGLWAKAAHIDRRTSAEEWTINFGNLDGTRATDVVTECLAAFFVSWLDGAPVAPILDRPSVS